MLNRNVLYADTGCYESPRAAAELELCPGVGAALARLRDAGFLLILVSNQPNAVKGKCSRTELDSIHAQLVSELEADGITLDAAYYCHHHPDHTGPCCCRKPEPYFLELAAATFNLTLSLCWMIGDRASDIECGRRAAASTIWIDTSEGEAAHKAADYITRGLGDAVDVILGQI